MDEFALIERYFASAGAERDDVRLGIGDDAALIAPPPGHMAAIATDTIVSGVHFPPMLDPRAVGHRALAVNLSDLAAMGAAPAHAFLALSLPSADVNWLAPFAEGLGALARMHEVALIGGDTTRSEVLTATVTAVGWLGLEAEPLTRKGAEVGELVAVSGTPGDAAAGLAAIFDGDVSPGAGALVERFAYPQPRVRCGQCLRGLASAAIDVSDGLLADAAKLAHASRVQITLEAERVPLSAALSARHDRERGEVLALTGGDDYELLFTLAPARAQELAAIAEDAGCALTVIGRVHEAGADGAGAQATRGGRRLDLSARGYRHFES